MRSPTRFPLKIYNPAKYAGPLSAIRRLRLSIWPACKQKAFSGTHSWYQSRVHLVQGAERDVKLKSPTPSEPHDKRRCPGCPAAENTGLRLPPHLRPTKKINTLEREQKNKPLKRLMNFKSASHWNQENVSIARGLSRLTLPRSSSLFLPSPSRPCTFSSHLLIIQRH